MAKPKGSIVIEQEKCKGCGLCEANCPQGIIVLDTSVLNSKGYHPAKVASLDQCIACCYCGLICPDVVIMVERLDQ